MPIISQGKRHHIAVLMHEGKSQRKITQIVGVSLNGVQGVIRRYREGLGVKNRPKSNKSKKILSQRDERALLVKSKKFPKLTSAMLRVQCGLQMASVDTIKRSLRSNGQFGRIACKKPHLTIRQKRMRFLWCKAKNKWLVNDWEKIIFSDESKIELEPHRREYVRRSKNSTNTVKI